MRIIARSDRQLFDRLLRAEGLQIVGRCQTDPLEKTAPAESIVALASTMTERARTHHELTARQVAITELAETAGYLVGLSEGLNQAPGTEYDPLLMKLRFPRPEEEAEEEQEANGNGEEAEGEDGGAEEESPFPPPNA